MDPLIGLCCSEWEHSRCGGCAFPEIPDHVHVRHLQGDAWMSRVSLLMPGCPLQFCENFLRICKLKVAKNCYKSRSHTRLLGGHQQRSAAPPSRRDDIPPPPPDDLRTKCVAAMWSGDVIAPARMGTVSLSMPGCSFAFFLSISLDL